MCTYTDDIIPSLFLQLETGDFHHYLSASHAKAKSYIDNDRVLISDLCSMQANTHTFFISSLYGFNRHTFTVVFKMTPFSFLRRYTPFPLCSCIVYGPSQRWLSLSPFFESLWLFLFRASDPTSNTYPLMIIITGYYYYYYPKYYDLLCSNYNH